MEVRYIYALWCPLSGQYRYVGMTNNPETRFRYHASGGDPGDRRSWIDALKRRGLSPTMVVLETVSADIVYKVEGAWIRRMLERGHNLTNATRPGLPRQMKQLFFCKIESEISHAVEDMAAEMALTPSDVIGTALKRLAVREFGERRTLKRQIEKEQ